MYTQHTITTASFVVPYILFLACTVVYAQQSSEATHSCTSTDSSLERARLLGMPQAVDTKNAEFENESFWNDHGSMIQQAWREWEMEHATTLSDFTDNVKERGWMDPSLLEVIDDAFANPSEETEAAVKSLWTNNGGTNNNQVMPKGVYATQLLSPRGVSYLRNLFGLASSSGIPTRRPNGMNRHGMILDSNVKGAVPIQPLVETVEEIIDRILRPVGRMLFQDRIGCEDDVDYYAFSISYDGADTTSTMQSKDMELKEHRDASVVTLNINLNLPEENYEGSEVFFREYPGADNSWSSDVFGDNSKDDEDGGGTVSFSPGMGVIHLGAHRHGALPITFNDSYSNSEGKQSSGGKRFNLVIWLFGPTGDVRIAPYSEEEQLTAKQRWHGCNQR